MRFLCVVLTGLYGAFGIIPQAGANPAEREARMRFNASLPPNCTRGWRGRGNGFVAICALGGRYQVRFIDGRIIVCGMPSCMGRAAEIDAFLRQRGA